MSDHLRSAEAIAARAASRRATRASTRSTQRPGSERTELEVGDHVVCRRETGSSGTWSRYDGRDGYVVTINAEEYENGSTYVELGVAWSASSARSHPAVDAWFRADELELVT